MGDFVSLLYQLATISFALKAIFLFVSFLYGGFSFVMFNQIRTMNSSVHIGDSSSFFLQLLSLIQIVCAVSLFITTAVIL